MKYAIIDNGLVANIAVADADFAASQGWIEAPAEVRIGWSWNGEVFTPPPDPPLEDAREALWEQVKVIRDQRIDAGVPVPGIGVFDSDLVSRTNISGSVTGALVAQANSLPFTVSWKLADNTIVTLDGPGMIAAGMAVMQYVAACHANAQTLGLAIQAAEDVGALDAIDIGAGWP